MNHRSTNKGCSSSSGISIDRSSVGSSDSGIYLESSFEELWSRIKDSKRPLVAEGREVNYQRFLRRIKLYEGCKFKITTVIVSRNASSNN